GTLAAVLERTRAAGLAVEQPASLFGLAVVLSNLVSNVPAVMLLLPVATHPLAGATLALASTLAGNLLVVGSIANIIVVDAARRGGVDHHGCRAGRRGALAVGSGLLSAGCGVRSLSRRLRGQVSPPALARPDPTAGG